MKRSLMFCLVFTLGALWGHYGPVYVVLPRSAHCWSDGNGGDGCGMCPWHDDPEETRERERKEQEKRDSGHCGADGTPEPNQNNPGVYGGIR